MLVSLHTSAFGHSTFESAGFAVAVVVVMGLAFAVRRAFERSAPSDEERPDDNGR